MRRTLLIGACALPALTALPPAWAQPWRRKYDWLPTECAPRQFPMRLISGVLGSARGPIAYIPDRRDVANGWGERGSTHNVGDPYKPVPSRLSLQWFSYTENRFFGGAWELPHEAMSELFRQKVPDRRGAPPLGFERIIVGIAPEGFAALWMAAGAEVVEMATFRAGPIELPWRTVIDNPSVGREAFIDMVLSQRVPPAERERLRAQGVPSGLFDRYHRRYPWKPYVSGTRQPRSLQVTSFNGESALILAAGPVLPKVGWSAPRRLWLEWITDEGKGRASEIDLDEAQTLNAFEQLAATDSKAPIELAMATTPSSVRLVLRTKSQEIALDRARTQVYSCC